MKTLQIRLPDSIHSKARKLAKEEHISLNQFLLTSVSNEVIRHETSEFFKHAVSNFDAEAFEQALQSVPDVPANKEDCIPHRRVAEERETYGNK